jgi:hypothetical protein
MRIYDKRGFIRFELEVKGKLASMLPGMISNLEKWPELVAGMMRAFVDWLQPDHDQANISRAPLAPWWSALVGSVDQLRVAVARIAASWERRKRWTRQNAANFLLYLKALGGDVSELLEEAERRWTPVHQAILNQAYQVHSYG